MPPESPPLPPKPEVALALLQTAASVYVHLDPRSEEVVVPPWFKNQPQLVLQVGLNMAVPIPDLDVGKDAVSCTLSFNRRPEFCRIPWESIYGLVGEDGRGMIWPESIPPEVAAAADGRAAAPPKPTKPRAHLRVASTEQKTPSESGVDSVQAHSPAPAAREDLRRQAEEALRGPKPDPLSAARGSQSDRSGRRRELPPYLRVVK